MFQSLDVRTILGPDNPVGSMTITRLTYILRNEHLETGRRCPHGDARECTLFREDNCTRTEVLRSCLGRTSGPLGKLNLDTRIVSEGFITERILSEEQRIQPLIRVCF